MGIFAFFAGNSGENFVTTLAGTCARCKQTKHVNVNDKDAFFVSECDDTDRDVSCLITPVTRTFVQYSMLLRI